MEISEPQQQGSVAISRITQVLECSICLNFIVEPVTICCGHSFCKMCLVKSLRQSKKKCPHCRAVCHMSAEDAPINSTIKNLAMLVDPEMYAKRMIEHEEEKKSWDSVNPIFYYNDPLFPNGNLSLHLFEARYKLMMQRIVNTTRSFAYVPNLNTYDAKVGDIALRAVLKEVEFLPDGRCLLEAKLEGRYRIVEHYVEEGTQGLHYCRMECFADLPVTDAVEIEEIKQYVTEIEDICRFLLQGSIKQKIEAYHGPPPRDPEALSLWLCGVCLTNAATKMEMLSSQNTVVRLRAGMEGLRTLLTRVKACTQSRHHLSAPSPTNADSSSPPTGAGEEGEGEGERNSVGESGSGSGSGGVDMDTSSTSNTL